MKLRTTSAVLLLGFCLSLPASAELTRQQKIDDFNYLVSVLNRNYAAYEWKRNALGFEMLDTAPWIQKIESTRTDFEYLEVLADYVAQLRDTNTYLLFPSDFVATLGFTVDLYDGKALIETIDRDQLSEQNFPFAVGDELISLDGKPIEQWIREMLPYSIESTERANRRLAAELITIRPQRFIPRAPEIGETATAVIRSWDGADNIAVLPWKKEGVPLEIGPIPDFKSSRLARADNTDTTVTASAKTAGDLYVRHQTGGGSPKITVTPPSVTGGGRRPLYDLPDGFRQRLGNLAVDAVFSGTFETGGKRIGYIRFPAFSSQRDLDVEINFMQQNTDGLVIDMMRADGTYCTQERVAARLIGRTFQQPGFQLRATAALIDIYQQNVELAEVLGLPAEAINYYAMILNELESAYAKGDRLTYPLPFCGTSLNSEPVVTTQNAVVAYRKPIVVIVDEFSSDFLPAALKDNGRGTLYGMTTRAYTGFASRLPGPAIVETDIVVKDGMMARTRFVPTTGFPDSPYVENTGVRPDIEADFMTVENQRTKGKRFVEGWTKAILDAIAAGSN